MLEPRLFFVLFCVYYLDLLYVMDTVFLFASTFCLENIVVLQTKGTSSFGKRHNKTHTLCVRCNRSAYHIQKKVCASCRYPAARKRICESIIIHNVMIAGPHYLPLCVCVQITGVRRLSVVAPLVLVACATSVLFAGKQETGSEKVLKPRSGNQEPNPKRKLT